jgi:aldose 1-epimerase
MVCMPNLTKIPLTGAQYAIAAGDYEAAVTGLGAGLRQLTHRGKPVIAGYEPDQVPPSGSGQLLAPWPNRVARGQYSFDGGTYQLDLSEPSRGNAIHGLTRWATWEPAREADAGGAGAPPTVVTLRHVLLGSPGYPFCLELTAQYRLGPADGLQVTITARNAGSRRAPYGTGSHPYLTAGMPVIDDCELELPAGRRLPADDHGIPAGPEQDVTGTHDDFRRPRRIADTSLDDALTGLARDSDGRARARLTGSGTTVELWAGEGYDWLQVFTGDGLDVEHRRRALAVEPMTCAPNAFATGSGLLVIEPGASVTHTWGLRVTQH